MELMDNRADASKVDLHFLKTCIRSSPRTIPSVTLKPGGTFAPIKRTYKHCTFCDITHISCGFL